MRLDTCVLIPTHKRPHAQLTTKSLRRQGYTGRIIYVVDDEDPTLPEYIEQFGDDVVVFSKEDAATQTDDGHNWGDRTSAVYARNFSFRAVKDAGYRYFIMLDDDYSMWYYRFREDRTYGVTRIKSLDLLFASLVEYLSEAPLRCISISHSGDHAGGGAGKTEIGANRKALSVYVCDVERPYQFRGMMEDYITHIHEQSRGNTMLSVTMAQYVCKEALHQNEGGLHDVYESRGMYTSCFFTVMYAPSCCRVDAQSPDKMYHAINGPAAYPRIIHEQHRKAR